MTTPILVQHEAGRGTEPGTLDSVAADRWRSAGLLIGLVAFVVVIHLPTLGQPLLEAHAFRQAQTAYTALEFHRGGIDLLHPTLPVFGPPWEVPFEFPLFQAAASIPMAWGLSPDTALRSTSLAFFIVTLVVLWLLVHHVAGRLAAHMAVAVLALTPLGLMWSRSSLIENLATAGALGFVYFGIRWREDRRWHMALLALSSGLVGMLVKPTTAVFWVLPLFLYQTRGEQRSLWGFIRARLDSVLLVVSVVPLVAAAWWTHHADTIKAASPATAWLTSSGLRQWNFGTMMQRTQLSGWSTVNTRLQSLVTGLPPWLLMPATVLARPANPLFWLGVVMAGALPVVVFFNLYVVHDYYLVAVAPAAAALVGMLVDRLAAVVRPRLRALVVAASCAGIAVLSIVGADYWQRMYQPVDLDYRMPGLRDVAAQTGPTDSIIVEGLDWSPDFLYYARRRGYMLTPATAAPELFSKLPGDHRFLFTTGLTSATAQVLERERWNGVFGEHLYVMGSRESEVAAALITTSDSTSRLARGTRIADGFDITCDVAARQVALPDAARTFRQVALEVEPLDPGVVLRVSPEHGPVPARSVVLIDAAVVRDGSLVVACRGAPSVRIEGVYGLGEG